MLASLGVGMLALAALAIGLVGGAVVNILADSLPREQWEWRLGSCAKCGSPLPVWWYVPLLGLLRRDACCSQCHKLLPRRHGWVGLAAPATLLLLVWSIADDVSRKLPPGGVFGLYGLATLALLLIFVIDLEHHLILDVV